MKKKIKKPGKGPLAHGAIKRPEMAFYGNFKSDYGVELPCSTTGENQYAIYYELKDIRKLSQWLNSVADWIESKRK